MVGRTIVSLEPIYVQGSHEEFVEAVGNKLEELVDRHPDGAQLNVKNVSHALAFSPNGEMHWSAFVTGELTWPDDDGPVLDTAG